MADVKANVRVGRSRPLTYLVPSGTAIGAEVIVPPTYWQDGPQRGVVVDLDGPFYQGRCLTARVAAPTEPGDTWTGGGYIDDEGRRVIRLDDLTAPERRLVLALADAYKKTTESREDQP